MKAAIADRIWLQAAAVLTLPKANVDMNNQIAARAMIQLGKVFAQKY
jgi:hypothetical protein